MFVTSWFKCPLVEEWKLSWYGATISFYVARVHFCGREQYYQQTKAVVLMAMSARQGENLKKQQQQQQKRLKNRKQLIIIIIKPVKLKKLKD